MNIVPFFEQQQKNALIVAIIWPTIGIFNDQLFRNILPFVLFHITNLIW